MIDKKKSVVFLFINGPHHVYHLILPALKHASIINNTKTIIISGNPTNTKIIKEAKILTGITQFNLIDIPVPFRYRFKNYKKKIYPPVYTRIKKIVGILKNASAIISTSHELPKHLEFYKIKGPTLFYLYHGTGTREYGFENKLKDFDYILTPGNYHKERLKKTLLISDEKINIVGTPKSDWIKLKKIRNNNLFNNESPVFYYVPHWDINLSSYLKWRKIILNYFINNNQYNLIFAPHPLIKHLSKKEGYKIENNLKSANNIIIDHGGKNSIDGTYSALADIYIGDVSSMITEWILQKPRPCIFINAHEKKWKNEDDYYMWNFGSVVSEFNDFEKIIKKSINSNDYEKIQKQMRDEFVQLNTKPSSDLCAEFIANKITSLQ
mgnify:CR=1 FL=1